MVIGSYYSCAYPSIAARSQKDNDVLKLFVIIKKKNI